MPGVTDHLDQASSALRHAFRKYRRQSKGTRLRGLFSCKTKVHKEKTMERNGADMRKQISGIVSVAG